MKTRCPGCDTRYQVDADALLDSEGFAHCYRCGTVFDAVTETASETPNTRNAGGRSLLWLKEQDEIAVQKQAASDLPFDVPANLPTIEPSDDVALDIADTLYEKRSYRGLFYGLFAFVLAAGVAIQLAWQYRLTLLARFPQLEFVCEHLPCRPTVVHAPEKLRVVRRAMQATANDPESLTLSASFRNDADVAQLLPDIQLSLLDNNGAAVIRRRLSPHEYLYPPPENKPVIQPGEVITISIDFADPGDAATGFEINFF